MIPAHTPVGTVVFVLQGVPHMATVNAELWQAGDQWIVGTDRKMTNGETFTNVANAENCHALADLVAQASWNGADVLKALGVKLGSDVPFVEVLKSLGREADLRELEALRERAAKWDALMKPSNMPIISMPPDPAPDLAIAAERIASACEAINARLESVIGSRYLDTGAPRMAEVDFIRIGEVGE